MHCRQVNGPQKAADRWVHFVRIEGLTNDLTRVTAQEIKVSVNDFIIKAAAIALTRVPQVNVSWDLKTQEVR